MKVLITGAAGQLARLLARALQADGHEVVGLDVRPVRTDHFPGPTERVKRYDHRTVAEVFRVHQPEAMVHLGIRAGGYRAQARQRYTQNVLGTRHLLELALRHRLARVVVLGTYHVYGAHPHNPTFLREEAPLRAGQTFPELQDAVELDHTVTNFLWRHRDVPTVLLRPVNVVGPHLRNQMSTVLRAKLCPRVMGFNPMQQFLHESDMVRALQLALSGEKSAVYNVAGEGAIPWERAIRTAGGRPVAIPAGIAYPTLALLSRFNVSFPEHLIEYFRYPVIIADGLMRDDLGWEPQVNVVDTLRSVHDVPADVGEPVSAGSR